MQTKHYAYFMKNVIATLPVLMSLLIAGCAFVKEGPTQIIHVGFNQPAEAKARCFFENKLFKHEFVAPGDVRVQKSRDPIQVYCKTANGRQAEMTLHPRLAGEFWENNYNLCTGAYMDLISRSAYVYPNYIVLDFDADNATVYYKKPPQTYAEHYKEEFEEEQAIAIERANRVFQDSASGLSKFEIKPMRSLDDMLPNLPEPETKREIITEDDPRWGDFERYLEQTSDPNGRPLDIRPPNGLNN